MHLLGERLLGLPDAVRDHADKLAYPIETEFSRLAGQLGMPGPWPEEAATQSEGRAAEARIFVSTCREVATEVLALRK